MLELLLPALIFVAALLYSSVGHGGASGYLAAMALVGIAPAEMKPAALVLNVLVSSVAAFNYWRAGHFRWHLFWPLALLSVPAAYLGGTLHLPPHLYRPLLGLVLLFAAWRLLAKDQIIAPMAREPNRALMLGAGSVIGLLSGLTGVGGGIFLSPLMLFAGWAGARHASAVAAPFILCNSLAGLLGMMTSAVSFPDALHWWALAALAGGFIGGYLGSKRLASRNLMRLLSAVLVIAGLKMLLS